MTLLVRHTDVLGGYEVGKGGGIIGGFNPLNPFRGWRTYEITATHEDDAGVELPIIAIRKTSGPITDTIAQVQARTGGGSVPKVWFTPVASGSYPQFAWYFLDPATLAFVAGPLLPLGNVALGNLSEETRKETPLTSHVLQWFEMTPPTGPYIGVLVSRDPSPEHPLFVSGHPVEIVADLLTRKGETYDAASATAVMASLGPELQHIVPFTDKDQKPQDVIDALSEAYGFAVRRSNTTGEAEFVHWREKIGALPTPTIGINDVRADGGPTFDLADATRLTRVRVTGQTLAPWVPGGVTVPRLVGLAGPIGRRLMEKVALLSTEKPASGIAIIQSEIAFDFSQDGTTLDSETFGEAEAEIDVAGQPGLLNTVAGGASPFSFEQWAEGVARLYFDSNSRGRVMATVPCLRGTDADDLGIGDAVTLDLDHAVNAQLGQTPTAQRGGPRPYRITAVNPELPGNVLTCADEGTGEQYDTVPEIFVEPDPVQTDLLVVTIDNASDLATDRAQVEFQVRAVADGDTIDLSDPGLRYTVADATDWTLDPMLLRFGPFPVGHTIYVRARAWLIGGAASDWSSWWSIGGEVTGPQTTLSDLVISAITDDGADLSWSYDESPPVGDVKVQYREMLVGGAWTTFSTLAPGTESETITGLDPATQYDVRVILDDSGEYGNELLGSFRTASGAITSLVVGTPTPSSVALSWTNTDGTHAVRVQKKLDTASVYEVVIDLPAGSTSYALTGLTAETDYDVRVVLVDGGGNEIGTALTDSFTTDLAANQTQLDTPTGAEVFGGYNPAATPPASSPGTYGLQVTAVFGPPDLEIVFEEAVETAVGSGTPGAYSIVAQIPAVVGDVTRYIANAPNDGKLRYLRAYAVASGYDDSDPTTALSVDPWPDTPTVPTPASQTVGGMMPFYIAPGESFTIPAYRQGLYSVPIDNEGTLIVDGVLEGVD